MKQYSVQVYSHEVNVSADYENMDRAFEMFFKAMYSGGYERGRLVDVESGRVLMNFKHSVDGENWHIHHAIDKEAIPALIKREIYQR